jgi:hypothetical protein
MIHRGAAAFGSEAQARRESAEKSKRNAMSEQRSVRDKLLRSFTCELLLLLDCLRPPRLRGE